MRVVIAEGLCLHCQGELGAVWRPRDGPFCCRGCRGVHELIHGSGLTRYYDLRRGRQSPAATLRPASLAWLERLLKERGESGERPFRLSLDIQGVHCAACIWLLEELFRRQPGGLDLTINPTLGKVDLVWDPGASDLRHYLEEIEKFGYRLGPAREGARRQSRSLILRMGVCVAMALNVMTFTFSYYFGLAPEDGALYRFFGALSFGLATVAVAAGGPIFFRGAVAGLRRRMAHLDLPISTGILLAYAGSVYGYLSHGPGAAYFDSLTLFVALMLIGRWAQEHVLERNRNALLDGAGAEHLVVKRQRAGHLEAITAPELAGGDEMWIAPGDLVPVEGLLLRRAARVSLDWITGESEPVTFEPGDTVPAGAFNAGTGGFTVAATEDFAGSRLNDLLRAESGSGDEDRPRWWTRVATGYVVAVLVLSALAFLIWAPSDLRRALEVTVAVLVVTCPCALGLASPLAHELLHHALRKRGVFVRRPGFMDRALAVRKIIFDKTGTLTHGNLVLKPASRKALWRLDRECRRILGNMVVRSNHPVSRALAVALAPAGGNRASASENHLEAAGESLCELSGKGLEWHREGVLYRLGKADFAAPRKTAGESPGAPGKVSETRLAIEAQLTTETLTTETLFTADGRALAAFRFSEELKADAAGEVAALREAGYRPFLLSGDSEAKVEAARRALGIEQTQALAGQDPEAKARVVRSLDHRDTLMVGDGLNDSLSFEAALCTATPAVDRPVLPGKADFYFLGDGISAIRRALGAAQRLRRVIRDNLIVAVVYNLSAVGLCFAGLVTPVVAAILMPVSSVGIVSLTAWRLTGRRLTWMS